MEVEPTSRADDMLPLSLPMDTVSEILSRTPVKSVCRFRCVSKAWHALISDAAFLATHREPSHLIVANSASDAACGSIDWYCRDLRLMDLNGNVVRVIKRAGTFLMTCSGAVDGPTCITTNGSVVSLIDLATGNVRATSLAQEAGRPGYEDFIFGVGCAVPSGTHKMVSLETLHTCNVLTLEGDVEWRQAQSCPAQVSLGYRQRLSVTVNGVMHFLYNLVTPQGDDEDHILRFDLESEEWKEPIRGPVRVMGPDGWPQERTYMIELDDMLCIVELEERFTHLWLLDDSVDSTWVKTYTIPMAPTTRAEVPLTMMRDSGKLLVYCSPSPYFPTAVPMLQVYDPLTGSRTHLVTFRDQGEDAVGICRIDLKDVVSPAGG